MSDAKPSAAPVSLPNAAIDFNKLHAGLLAGKPGHEAVAGAIMKAPQDTAATMAAKSALKAAEAEHAAAVKAAGAKPDAKAAAAVEAAAQRFGVAKVAARAAGLPVA